MSALHRRGILEASGSVASGAHRALTGGPYNASNPLTVPTYDGSGEATHPDVLDFYAEHGLATWNGWRYWMAMTPFDASNNDLENPSIVVSSDGLTWQDPAGITNPIVGPPADLANYYSDTDLVYDPDTSRLYCFFRFYEAGHATSQYQGWAIYSTDGVTWTGAQEVYTANNVYFRLSPAVMRLDTDDWCKWVVERALTPNGVHFYRSTDPLEWPAHTAATLCSLANLPTGQEPWHVDVFRHGGSFFMLLDTCDTGTDGVNAQLVLGASSDGVTWALSDPVIPPPASGWDDNRVYRASGYIEGDTLRVWYSARSDLNAWRIGYTTIPASEFPVPA